MKPIVDDGYGPPTQIEEAPPAFLARLTGLLLIVMAVCAVFADLGVRTALVVPGNAAATARRILASESLFRAGFLGYLIAFLCDVPVSICLYLLLAPVSRPLSLTAAGLRLVYAAIVGASLLQYFGAIVVLAGRSSFSAFPPEQLEALALLFLSLFKHGFSLALVFFGVHLLVLGALLSRSTRFPRVFGGLIALAGLSYLTDTLLFFLAPAFHTKVAPVLAVPAMAELLFAVWLVVKGVKRPLAGEPIVAVEVAVE
jgi:Domain of unknown function (DUF4386)